MLIILPDPYGVYGSAGQEQPFYYGGFPSSVMRQDRHVSYLIACIFFHKNPLPYRYIACYIHSTFFLIIPFYSIHYFFIAIIFFIDDKKIPPRGFPHSGLQPISLYFSSAARQNAANRPTGQTRPYRRPALHQRPANL